MTGKRRVILFVALVVVAAALTFLFGGCALTKGRIKGHGVTVQGVKDGNGAKLDTNTSAEVLTLPAGTRVTTVKETAMPATPATETSPAIPPKPATETTQFVLNRDSQWRKDEKRIAADVGQIDQTVAVKRLEIAERKWLLWTAIACGVAGLIVKASFPAWPSVSNGLLLAAVAAGAAWKLSDIPAWTWLAVIGVSVLLVMGYKRREKDEREAKEELAKAKVVTVPVVVPVDPPRAA